MPCGVIFLFLIVRLTSPFHCSPPVAAEGLRMQGRLWAVSRVAYAATDLRELYGARHGPVTQRLLGMEFKGLADACLRQSPF